MEYAQLIFCVGSTEEHSFASFFPKITELNLHGCRGAQMSSYAAGACPQREKERRRQGDNCNTGRERKGGRAREGEKETGAALRHSERSRERGTE